MIERQGESELTEHQRRAVEHGDAPLVVAAGAGSGKTRVLTERVARLLNAGVVPERILLLTFTRRAAASMTSRAAALVADPGIAGRIAGGTFHAIAHRVVAEQAHHLGLLDVNVIDPADVVDLIDLLRAEHGLDGTDRRLPTSRTIADIYSRAVNTGTSARAVMAQQFPWAREHADEITALLRAYAARKRDRGLLDLDDLLIYWRALLRDEDVGSRLRARWDWVLVDEYQDVNQIQADIVDGLCPSGRGLTVVGDDAQAIYGFRGADPGHLSAVVDRFDDCTVVPLERNFRSVQPILDLANEIRPGTMPLRLVAHRTETAGRPSLVSCANADEEARSVADRVLAAHIEGVPLREQAVLMRTGSHSDLLEVELSVRKIPFVKFGGIGYLQTAHMRDLLAALRVTLSPYDEVSWYRILTRHRAIGKAHARTLAAQLAESGFEQIDEVVAAAPPKASTALRATLDHLADAASAMSTPAIVESAQQALLPLLQVHYADWQRRAEDVTQLAGAAARCTDLRAFVAEQAIDPVNVAGDWAKTPHLDEDYLILSTIHSAKGLEWTQVHVLRACDGAIPSDMALSDEAGLQEEHRLFYVALTRARDELYLYSPARLPTHPTSFNARHVATKPSRFLTDAARAHLDVDDPASQRTPRHRPESRPSPGAARRVAVDTMDDLFA
ncbi:UvrD-helicase domain-containing protein [Epidermidibacterium keratini]|uniref:DNA 3'-5' helicase n=1 Tax=Epidermidibacterium keratini TaxID=1891644 RepID=A0A7L4YR34_9ACTN|nr:ATP-dependent helicase [Epidermidibacterium keratini]QHC01027.1 UvrD-helicase domain-containing protein [Epidermidibacterium keratini]